MLPWCESSKCNQCNNVIFNCLGNSLPDSWMAFNTRSGMKLYDFLVDSSSTIRGKDSLFMIRGICR